MNILMNQKPGSTDLWAPNNFLTLEQRKNISWTPVGQATDKKLRPQPTKMKSYSGSHKKINGIPVMKLKFHFIRDSHQPEIMLIFTIKASLHISDSRRRLAYKS